MASFMLSKPELTLIPFLASSEALRIALLVTKGFNLRGRSNEIAVSISTRSKTEIYSGSFVMMRLGGAKKQMGLAWGLVKITVPNTDQSIPENSPNFELQGQKLRQVFRSKGQYLLGAFVPEGIPPSRAVETINRTDTDRRKIQDTQGGSFDSTDISSATREDRPHSNRRSSC